MMAIKEWLEPIGAMGAFVVSIFALLLSLKTERKMRDLHLADKKEKELSKLLSVIADADSKFTVSPSTTMNKRAEVVAQKAEVLENAFVKYERYLSQESRARLEGRIKNVKGQSELALANVDIDKEKMNQHFNNYANGMAEFVLDLSETAHRELGDASSVQ